jgi:hypothetical protein
MKLSTHEKAVLEKLNGTVWLSQYELHTSRQTMNKLIQSKLVERKITREKVSYIPESGAVYRLKQKCNNSRVEPKKAGEK